MQQRPVAGMRARRCITHTCITFALGERGHGPQARSFQVLAAPDHRDGQLCCPGAHLCVRGLASVVDGLGDVMAWAVEP